MTREEYDELQEQLYTLTDKRRRLEARVKNLNQKIDVLWTESRDLLDKAPTLYFSRNPERKEKKWYPLFVDPK